MAVSPPRRRSIVCLHAPTLRSDHSVLADLVAGLRADGRDPAHVPAVSAGHYQFGARARPGRQALWDQHVGTSTGRSGRCRHDRPRLFAGRDRPGREPGLAGTHGRERRHGVRFDRYRWYAPSRIAVRLRSVDRSLPHRLFVPEVLGEWTHEHLRRGIGGAPVWDSAGTALANRSRLGRSHGPGDRLGDRMGRRRNRAVPARNSLQLVRFDTASTTTTVLHTLPGAGRHFVDLVRATDGLIFGAVGVTPTNGPEPPGQVAVLDPSTDALSIVDIAALEFNAAPVEASDGHLYGVASVRVQSTPSSSTREPTIYRLRRSSGGGLAYELFPGTPRVLDRLTRALDRWLHVRRDRAEPNLPVRSARAGQRRRRIPVRDRACVQRRRWAVGSVDSARRRRRVPVRSPHEGGGVGPHAGRVPAESDHGGARAEGKLSRRVRNEPGRRCARNPVSRVLCHRGRRHAEDAGLPSGGRFRRGQRRARSDRARWAGQLPFSPRPGARWYVRGAAVR